MNAGRLTADHLRGREDRYFHDLEHLDSRLRKYLKGNVRSLSGPINIWGKKYTAQHTR